MSSPPAPPSRRLSSSSSTSSLRTHSRKSAPANWRATGTLSRKSVQSGLSLVVAQAGSAAGLGDARAKLPAVSPKSEGAAEKPAEPAPPTAKPSPPPTEPATPVPQTPVPQTPGVDESVPPLRTTPPSSPPPPPAPAPLPAGGGALGLPRYSLALPLLGRPKVPLDAALRSAADPGAQRAAEPDKAAYAAAVHEGYLPPAVVVQVDESAAAPEPATSPPTTTAAPAPEHAPQPSTSPNTDAAPPSTDAPTSTSPSDAAPGSSSWWAYVPAWPSRPPSSAGAPPAGAAAPETPFDPDADPEAGVVGYDMEGPPSAVAVALVSAPTDAPVEPANPAGAPAPETTSPSPPPADPPRHARSVTTAESASAAAWYAPWTWYAPGAPVASAAPPPGSAAAAAEEGEAERGRLTAAEAVKRDALARDQESAEGGEGLSPPTPALPERAASAPPARPSEAPAEPAQPPASPPTTPGLPNPIERSLVSNIPGWSSFFTSRALGAKRVAEAEEMEVMDVPDEEPGANEARLVVSGAEPEKEKSKDGEKGKEEGEKGEKRARAASLAPSKASTSSGAPKSAGLPTPPNLVLPLFAETFTSPPRSLVLDVPPAPAPTSPPAAGSGQQRPTLLKTARWAASFMRAGGGKGKERERSGSVGGVVSPGAGAGAMGSGGSMREASATTSAMRERDAEEERMVHELARRLPRTHEVADPSTINPDPLRGAKRAVVLGIHGWFPGALIKSLAGEPTGTSSKFADMAAAALERYAAQHGVTWEKITQCALEGEGRIGERVQRLYDALAANKGWMADLRAADVVFVACHSQGSIVATHLLDRLLADGHVHTGAGDAQKAPEQQPKQPVLARAQSAAEDALARVLPRQRAPQRVVCLALCGIHLGPLRYLGSSSLLQPYFAYFEGAAARELFEFQSTESAVSQEYVGALGRVLGRGVKMVYVASLNDQVVPIYSGIFAAASHPLILRALYIDGDAYSSSDFLTNLLVLLTRILNAGLPDSGLALHLSEATAGSLSGIGHSTAYAEPGVYELAAEYLFRTTTPASPAPLRVEPFDAAAEQNDYEIPWRLRDLVAHPLVARLFGAALEDLRDGFRSWHPKTAVLRDVKRKLSPIQRLREGSAGTFGLGSAFGELSRL